jgi:hypothetical protein
MKFSRRIPPFFKYLLLLPTVVTLLLACQKENSFITSGDAKLDFSLDTISFDTIFTTVGSTTKNFRVYNPRKQSIEISSIYLAGGQQSNFRINVNGIESHKINNIEVRPEDSLYVFVEVTVDPNGTNLPMVIKDSIVFVTNGNTQDVNLLAYGQDVNLIKGVFYQEDVTWTLNKPYLILDSVWVDSSYTLSIDPGVQVFLHKNASIVIGGSIRVNGTLENPVVFRGDRLDDILTDIPYDDAPNQWDRIALLGTSSNNKIDHAIIRNATIGLQMEFTDLVLTNTIIRNMSYSGIFSVFAEINAYNCVIADCQAGNINVFLGGKYNFNHVTVANYWGQVGVQAGQRKVPSVLLRDWIEIFVDGESQSFVADLEEATFTNSIIYGSFHSEIGFSSFAGDGLFNYNFDNCLIKVHPDSVDITDPGKFTDITINKNPGFKDIKTWDYELDTLSPAMNIGKETYALEVPFDLNGNSRLNDLGPDAGAYERIEK